MLDINWDVALPLAAITLLIVLLCVGVYVNNKKSDEREEAFNTYCRQTYTKNSCDFVDTIGLSIEQKAAVLDKIEVVKK